MARILEALKRTDDPQPLPELTLTAVLAEQAAEEFVDHDMPFVEVGGPRKNAEATPRLELPAARLPSLHVRPPLSVALQSSPQPLRPQPRIAGELIAFHQPDHAVSQQYAALYNQLTQGCVDATAGAPVLVFTALAPGAGTTTALLNVAIAGCRMHNQRIVVVDANTARPAAARRLGLTADVGLQDVLQGKVALEQAVQSTSITNLHVLPGGNAAAAVQDQGDAIRWIVAWLRHRFDVVFLDAPAWQADSELRALLPGVNAVYLVVDAAETEKPEVRHVTREVARWGSRLGGLVVTK